MKRILLFVLTNILVVATIGIVLNLLGLRGYITAYGLDYQALMIYCLVWGFVGSFISLAMSKFMAKQFMGVQIVQPNDPHYSGLVNRVHQLAQSAGINKMPEVGVYQSPEVNAFATGPSKNNSLVAVSTGLLQRMNSDETEAVLAHEVSHVANGDMVTMTLVQGVVNAFAMFLSRVAAYFIVSAMNSNSDDDRPVTHSFAYIGITLLFDLLFSFLGMFVVAFFSRVREFRADAGAAQLVGANKMIMALQTLKSAYDLNDDSQSNFTSMKISSKGSKMMALLSTHPSLDRRIAALQRR